MAWLDVWIGGGGESVARLVVPVLRPAAYVPNHLGDFYHPFLNAYDNGPYKDDGLKKFLDSVGIRLLAPVQYLDRIDLDKSGLHVASNSDARSAFGLPDIPVVKDGGTDSGSDSGAARDGGGATTVPDEPWPTPRRSPR